jgi:hypothetical protein
MVKTWWIMIFCIKTLRENWEEETASSEKEKKRPNGPFSQQGALRLVSFCSEGPLGPSL